MRRRGTIRVLISLVVVVLAAAVLTAGHGYKKEIAALEAFVPLHMKVDRIPGLTIGFYKGDVTWVKGFGTADLENGIAANEKSSYRLASVSKSMTAVAVLQLAEKGKLKLDEPVQTYVPYFPQKKWTVTVRQLLGHLGGVSHYKNFESELHFKEHKDTREAVDVFAEFDLTAEPGTKYQYSSYGYNLLGAVVEGASREPFGVYMRKYIWEPLSMMDTCMEDPDALIPNRVKGYRLKEGEHRNSEFVDISSRFAAGGTRSTVPDLLKYARGFETGKLLSEESLRQMFTSMQTEDGRLTTYGMGWHVQPVNGRFCLFHTGGQAETRTLMVRFPDEEFALALAYNFEGGRLWDYGRRLAQLVLGDPWTMDVETGKKGTDLLYEGLFDVYNHGLAWYAHWGNRRDEASDAKDIEAAFAYVNRWLEPGLIDKDYGKARGAVANGVHPKAGEAFTKVGSYMAAQLASKFGMESLRSYHGTGPLQFFYDYILLCRSNGSIPRELRFNEGLEKQVEAWLPQWEKVNTPWVRRLWIDEHSDVGAVGAKLEALFAKSAIKPNFLQSLWDVNRYFYCSGKMKEALEVALIANRLYPRSPVPLAMRANVLLIYGKEDEAAGWYKKAFAIDPKAGVLSEASFFISAAYLDLAGDLEGAEVMMRKGLEFYPRSPRLHEGLAELYLLKGKRHLQKALEADPTYESARKRLKQLD